MKMDMPNTVAKKDKRNPESDSPQRRSPSFLGAETQPVKKLLPERTQKLSTPMAHVI